MQYVRFLNLSTFKRYLSKSEKSGKVSKLYDGKGEIDSAQGKD